MAIDLDAMSMSQTIFAEDVLSLVVDKPRLFNDIIAALRGSLRGSLDNPSGRRWRNVNPEVVETLLRDLGAHFGARKHGAGIAIYVCAVKFTQVTTGRGKVEDVRSY